MPSYEIEASFPTAHRVCGVDEAGRGPWAGPVVAAATMFANAAAIPQGLNDSKKLTAKKRDMLFDRIHASAQVGVGIASVEEIDTWNIWGATSLAMKRAVDALIVPPHVALIDGNRIPKGIHCEVRAIVKGDATSLSIAAASIIAKVTRDRLMAELARQYPHYGFDRHAGYGTPEHQNALQIHGPCAAHRRSFAPIARLLEAA